MRLETARLLLVACSLELVEALQGDRDRAHELAGAEVPEGWPDAELLGFLPIYAKRLRADASTLGFGVWILVERAGNVIVGSAGFLGRPQEGTVELGYGIHPAYRNAGYATEASSALVAWALAQEDVSQVIAECDRTNDPSVRVLEKAGMERIGERESMLLWSSS